MQAVRSSGAEGSSRQALQSERERSIELAGASRPSNQHSNGGTDPQQKVTRPKNEVAAGTLGSYLAHALEQSPEVRAAFSQWKADVHRIARARRLPEPTLSFGYFIRSVETRVGPQRARVGLQQAFPWPTKLSAGADSAAAEAQVAEKKFQSRALAVRRVVTDAYYHLWMIRETRKIHEDHLIVLRGLAETTRARLVLRPHKSGR